MTTAARTAAIAAFTAATAATASAALAAEAGDALSATAAALAAAEALGRFPVGESLLFDEARAAARAAYCLAFEARFGETPESEAFKKLSMALIDVDWRPLGARARSALRDAIAAVRSAEAADAARRALAAE